MQIIYKLFFKPPNSNSSLIGIVVVVNISTGTADLVRVTYEILKIFSHRSLKYFCQYQCCGSGMFIPDPGSRILFYVLPGSKTRKERGEKIIVVLPFL
jgi:hypothetical protein